MPSKDSEFFKNIVVFKNAKGKNIYKHYCEIDFPKIKSIAAKNCSSRKSRPIVSAIEGKGKGFESTAPYSSISRNYWSTVEHKNNHASYFDKYQPVIIDLELEFTEEFDALAVWSSRRTFGNSVKDFLIQTGRSKEKLNSSIPIHRVSNNRNPFEAELFKIPKVKAKYVRLTILSNHHDVGVGGKRVDIQEIAIVRSFENSVKDFHDNATIAPKIDLIRNLLPASIDDKHYRILNVDNEFSLDHLWFPGMTYDEFIAARGLGGRGKQLKRIRLSCIGDKIFMNHLLQEHGYNGMPILLQTNRLDDSFFEKVIELYNNGLKSFVLKVSHLGDSIGIYRVKNGRHIVTSDTAKKTSIDGYPVDFYYLKEEIKSQWYNQQYHEDWVSNAISPGAILEELIDDSTELKFSVVFGEVVGFFVRRPGLPCYDRDGRALTNIPYTLPNWWEGALKTAEEVARIFKADHLRVDIFYRDGEFIVCEVNWNGGERFPNYSMIEDALNYGYAYRKQYLQKQS